MISKFERFIAHRYLRSSKQEGFISVIAWFSLIGIALGVATLIIVMSVMNGFREELLGRIISLNGHMSVLAKGQPFTNYDQITQQVKNVEGITAVYPVIERQGMLIYRNQARGLMVRAIKPEDLVQRKMVADNIRDGSLKSFGSFEHEGEKTHWVAIGKRLADSLYLKIGDKITIVSPEGNVSAFGTLPQQKSVYIGAVFEVGLNDYDKSVVFIPLEAGQSLFKLPESVSNLEVFVDNPDAVHARGLKVTAAIGNDYQIFDWQNANNGLFQTVQVERNVMFVILTLLILIAAFNILSSLIMLVKDKTRDIAIMRTMGATQKNITTVFTAAPVKVPPGKSNTVCRLQLSSNCLRKATEALSVLLKNVFLITTPALPPAFSILIKCCKNKEAVSPVLIGKFCCTSARSLPPKGGLANTIS